MDFDRKLAEILKKYPVIWNRSRKYFKNIIKKENSFKALAAELNVTGKLCVLLIFVVINQLLNSSGNSD